MTNQPIQDFLTSQQEADLADASMRALRSDLRNFAAWWEERHHRPFIVSQLVTRDIRQWQQYRQQEVGVSPKTVNRNLVSLRRFCQWGIVAGILSDNPVTSIELLPEEHLGPRFLPDVAVDALLRAPSQIKDKRLRRRDEALLDHAGCSNGRAGGVWALCGIKKFYCLTSSKGKDYNTTRF